MVLNSEVDEKSFRMMCMTQAKVSGAKLAIYLLLQNGHNKDGATSTSAFLFFHSHPDELINTCISEHDPDELPARITPYSTAHSRSSDETQSVVSGCSTGRSYQAEHSSDVNLSVLQSL